jgi:hypothetical protein
LKLNDRFRRLASGRAGNLSQSTVTYSAGWNSFPPVRGSQELECVANLDFKLELVVIMLMIRVVDVSVNLERLNSLER